MDCTEVRTYPPSVYIREFDFPVGWGRKIVKEWHLNGDVQWCFALRDGDTFSITSEHDVKFAITDRNIVIHPNGTTRLFLSVQRILE